MSHRIFNRIVCLQALTVALFFLPFVGGGFYVWTQHQRLQAHVSDLEPRYARLAGLLQRSGDFKLMGEQAQARLAALSYPASTDTTQAGNDAQERIRALFADSKLDIVSIQVLPPAKDKEDVAFDHIQIHLKVEGEMVGIQNALSILTGQTPAVWVDNVTLQTIGAVKPASVQRLGGQFNFSVFRVRP